MEIRIEDDLFFDRDNLQAQSFGLWCYTSAYGSYYYTDGMTFDSKFQAARALGTTTLALGFCVWAFYLLAGCCRFGPISFRIAGFFCFCCATFQGLVFLVKKSEVCSDWCKLDTGGKCAIAAIYLWFIAFVMSCFAGKRANEDDDDKVATEEAPMEQDGAERGEYGRY